MYLQPPVDAMERDEIYYKVKSAIAARFEPATSEAEADLQLTSVMISERVREFSGKDMEVGLVNDLMEELGFIYAANSDMRFVWMIREKG